MPRDPERLADEIIRLCHQQGLDPCELHQVRGFKLDSALMEHLFQITRKDRLKGGKIRAQKKVSPDNGRNSG
jgi:hypothetical protein